MVQKFRNKYFLVLENNVEKIMKIVHNMKNLNHF